MFHNYKFSLILVAIYSMTFCSCATIINGFTQPINFSTYDNTPGTCKLKDEEREYDITVPSVVEVSHGDGPLEVTCLINNTNYSRYIPEHVSNAILGNIILFFSFPYIIDTMTGSYQEYPSEIFIGEEGIRY